MVYSDKVVLALSGASGNDAIRGLMIEFGNALAEIGVQIIQVSLEPAELQYAVDLMARGGVWFAITWLGSGQDLSILRDGNLSPVNVWDELGVPLVKIHGDSPAYFSDRHRDTPANSVNLYMAREFSHFRKRWMPSAQSISGVLTPLPLAPLPRTEVDKARRTTGSLYFLKNGNSASKLRGRWHQLLPRSVAETLSVMVEELMPDALRSGPLHIGDFVGSHFSKALVDPETMHGMILFFTAQLDDYIRRAKSELISRALLDFPVIVQGDAWDHVDFTGKKARHVPGQDFVVSRRIFTEELGVIDMSPNLDTGPHERVQRAAGAYALVLTNRQTWLQRDLPGFEELQFEFSFESIQSRIADVLANRARYIDLGISFGERYREVYSAAAFAHRLVAIVDLVTLQRSAPQPAIQPYFAWPM